MPQIVAFTGAGISQASGIPTFEEMPGIRDYLTRDYFERDPEGFYAKMRPLYLKIQEAQPNPAHLALARHKVPVITMNVDGLHARAGTKDLVEIHGNLDGVICPCCQKNYPFHIIETGVYCPDCNKILEPNVILYGDDIIEFPRAVRLVETADILLVIGTSFYTSTAGYVTDYARSLGCQVEIVNSCAEEKVPGFLEKTLGIIPGDTDR